MEKKLPIIELILSDDGEFTGVYANSFVSAPAIEKGFVFMKQHKPLRQIMAVDSGDKRMVYGPMMIPDLKIYRKDEKFGEYYATYSAETVRQCAHNYLKKNLQSSTTVEHAFPITGATMVESWIIEDPAHDKANALGYSDLPKSTWMAGYKVESDELWQLVKSGEVTGFSIESWFDHVPQEMSSDELSFDSFMDEFQKIFE